MTFFKTFSSPESSDFDIGSGKERFCCLPKNVCGVLCLAFLSVIGFVFIIAGILIVLYFDSFVDQLIKKEIPLQKGSAVTESWLNPPVKPYLTIYFFNMTNPKQFLEEGKKPILKEVGPFVYEEHWSKRNVNWLEDGRIVEYSPTKEYFFREDLSFSSEDLRLTLPNIPMISALATLRYRASYIRVALGSMLEILKQEPFAELSVKQILWGYDHPLVKLGKDVLPTEQRFPHDFFGILVGRNGTSNELLTAKTGINNINDVGQILTFNKENLLPFWKSPECNKLRGTDGSVFHPNVLTNETLYVFSRDVCQSMPLVFDQEVVSSGIPAYRFVPPAYTFSYGPSNPRGDCLCMSTNGCANLPNGIFNVSACQFGAPIIMSWPHFFQADPILLEEVEGLMPDKDIHQFYLDIQPKLGTVVRGAARTQLNIYLDREDLSKHGQGLRDIVFPFLWLSEGIEEIDDAEARSLLQLAVFAPDQAKHALYPTCFTIGCLILVLLLLYLTYQHYKKKHTEVFQTNAKSASNGYFDATIQQAHVAMRTVTNNQNEIRSGRPTFQNYSGMPS